MDERAYWLAFSACTGIGPARFATLLSAFGSAQSAWNATLTDFKNAHIGDTIAQIIDQFRATFSLSAFLRDLSKKHVGYLTLKDLEYPELLKQIKNPPFVLYTKGTLPQGPTIAVVGTCKPTAYGSEITEVFSSDLVAFGCVIVSGLALGVDAIAHQTAVENAGKTIAVLGCGVDCVYPRQNEKLYQSILDHGGAIVSELPPGKLPSIGSFPSRNRIIAGMSHSVLVTEGAVDSGSLITADYAFMINRPVFAIPGPVTSALSKGPHQLIEKGGNLVMNPEQILEKLNMKRIKAIKSTQSIKGRLKKNNE